MRTLVIAVVFLLFYLNTLSAQDTGVLVENIVKREMQERKIPGLQIVVVQHRKIAFSRSYGTANMAEEVPVDNQTIFPVNSCTKVFTAVAIMQLVEQGKINLSAKVKDYLTNLPESWQQVTVRQLLSHTSGLPDMLSLLDPRTGSLGSLKDEAGVWNKLITMPLEFQPGERFNYNQTNAYLLGKIIDQLSGQPFAEFFAENQFQPLGMSHTVFGDSRDIIPHYAPTYFYRTAADGKSFSQPRMMNNYYEFPYFRRAASGLNSSAEDMAKWIIALQNGQLLKSRSILDTMWSADHFNNGKPTPWALGWGMNKFRPRYKAVGMSGGSRAAFLLYPQNDLAVIILTNLSGSYPEDFLEEVAGCYLPGIIDSDPVTFLRTNLNKIGFDQAIKLVEKQIKKNPLFNPGEFELNEWAYRMMSSGQLKNALEILKLGVYLFPKSGNAYDSYGEGLLKSGNKAEAIKMYRRSIELDPGNEHGKKVLTELIKT